MLSFLTVPSFKLNLTLQCYMFWTPFWIPFCYFYLKQVPRFIKCLVSIANVEEGVIWTGLCDSSLLTFLSNLFYSTNDNSLHCQCSSCLFSANSVLVDHLTLNFSDSSGLSFVVSLTMHECHDLVIFLLVYVKAIRNARLWYKSYTRRS